MNESNHPKSESLSVPEHSEIDRREFLRTAGSVALFAALGITVTACNGTATDPGLEPPDDSNGGGNGITISGNTITINLTKSGGSPLASSGGWIANDDGGFIAVNVDGSTIRAFTNVCTHQSCTNAWTFSNSLFICTCHDSRFNTSGKVVSGPANADLKEFSVSRSGNIVTITKS